MFCLTNYISLFAYLHFHVVRPPLFQKCLYSLQNDIPGNPLMPSEFAFCNVLHSMRGKGINQWCWQKSAVVITVHMVPTQGFKTQCIE